MRKLFCAHSVSPRTENWFHRIIISATETISHKRLSCETIPFFFYCRIKIHWLSDNTNAGVMYMAFSGLRSFLAFARVFVVELRQDPWISFNRTSTSGIYSPIWYRTNRITQHMHSITSFRRNGKEHGQPITDNEKRLKTNRSYNRANEANNQTNRLLHSHICRSSLYQRCGFFALTQFILFALCLHHQF